MKESSPRWFKGREGITEAVCESYRRDHRFDQTGARRFSVLGSGEESRDYLYVEDVARAFMNIIRKADFNGEAINVASGNETRIVDLSRMVYAALGNVKEPILCPETRPGIPQRWCADVSKLQAFGFSPQVTMIDSLRRTISWIRTQRA